MRKCDRNGGHSNIMGLFFLFFSFKETESARTILILSFVLVLKPFRNILKTKVRKIMAYGNQYDDE